MSKLLALANSSGWKTNLKCCYLFPFPYVSKNKNRYIPYRFYKNCKVLRKIIWGAKKETGLTIEKMFAQTFALIQPWERFRLNHDALKLLTKLNLGHVDLIVTPKTVFSFYPVLSTLCQYQRIHLSTYLSTFIT